MRGPSWRSTRTVKRRYSKWPTSGWWATCFRSYRSWNGSSPQGPDLNNHFANGAALGQHLQGVHRPLEGQPGANPGPDLAFGQHVEQLGADALLDRGILFPRAAPHHPDDLTAFQQRQIQRNGRYPARRETDHEIAPLPGD